MASEPERLVDAGYDCYVVSNGNPEMLASMVVHAGIEDVVNETLSADAVERFKPAAELYRHAPGRTETPVENTAHVTAGWFDVMGARHAGMQGVRVNRNSEPWDPFDGEQDLTVEPFDELTSAIEA